MRGKADAQVVASLRFEVPVEAAGEGAASATGTVELNLAGSNVPVVQEVVNLRDGETFRVGRAPTNDLVLSNPDVSRFHALFSASRSGVVLSDLSSLNGTLHNDKPISTPVNLETGDVVRIGHVRVIIELRQESPLDEGDYAATQSNPIMRTAVVTVLVADVEGYTKKSQELSPVEVTQMLDRWLASVSDIVRNQGGQVDKYIGDCVLALWSADAQGVEPEARRAVEAARLIVAETEALAAAHWPHGALHPWRCRVSLNTGEAVLGTVGQKGRRDFTVLGDTVNLAFRLDSVAKQKGCRVLFSEATARCVASVVSLKRLGKVSIEGRAEQETVFTLK